MSTRFWLCHIASRHGPPRPVLIWRIAETRRSDVLSAREIVERDLYDVPGRGTLLERLDAKFPFEGEGEERAA